MANLDHILKSRDITLPKTVHLVKAMVFPVATYGWEIWTIRKARSRRIDAFELWCWRRLLRLLRTVKSSMDCKEIKPVNTKGNQSWTYMGRAVAEAKTPTLWQPDAKNTSIGEDLMLGKIEGRRRRGWQRMRWLDGMTSSMNITLSKLQELLKDREAWLSALHVVPKNQIRLSRHTYISHTYMMASPLNHSTHTHTSLVRSVKVVPSDLNSLEVHTPFWAYLDHSYGEIQRSSGGLFHFHLRGRGAELRWGVGSRGTMEDGDSGLRKVDLPWDLSPTHLVGPELSHSMLSSHVNSEGSRGDPGMTRVSVTMASLDFQG